jgi:dihydroorotate dehydrogenase electron transfer subunit
VSNQRLNRQFFVLTLQGDAISQTAKPGQFVNLSCQEFLRRPFGIMSVDPSQGTFQIGIQIKGSGTAQLAELKPDDTVSVLGPLGHGFDLDDCDQVITVGGGTGVFPLLYVQAAAKKAGKAGYAVCGFRSVRDAILVDDFRGLAIQSVMASDQGGLDIHGHAGQALEALLTDLNVTSSTAILTCGPKIMMQTVATIAQSHGIACQVSLEERMGCGIGICLVCVCKIKSEGETEISHQRCCVEGPVFKAEEVIW